MVSLENTDETSTVRSDCSEVGQTDIHGEKLDKQ